MIEGSQEYNESIVERLHKVSWHYMCMYMYMNAMLIICVGTSTFYSKAFESRSGKAASKQIWACHIMQIVKEAALSLWGVHVSSKVQS